MKRSTLLRIILPAAIVLVALFLSALMIRMRPKPDKEEAPRVRPQVTALPAVRAVRPVRITGYGTVAAKRRVEVTPQVSGRVLAKSPRFEAGEFVAAGDTLLVIEQTDYLQARALARSNLAAARTALATAEQEARVAREEWERVHPGVQATPLALREPQVAQARAAVDAAAAALDLAETNLDRCFLTAPFDGRVEASTADMGQYLRAGTPVGAVYAVDMAEITVPVPAADMAWIHTADPVTGQGGDQVEVHIDYAGRTVSWTGRAARLGGLVDAASRQVPVVVEIPAPFRPNDRRPAMLPGMFATVVFSSAPPPGAIAIPRDALRSDDVVWIVTPDRTLDIRPVDVAYAGVDQALITAGVEPGELVCTSNLQMAVQGMAVRLPQDPRKMADAGTDSASADSTATTGSGR